MHTSTQHTVCCCPNSSCCSSRVQHCAYGRCLVELAVNDCCLAGPMGMHSLCLCTCVWMDIFNADFNPGAHVLLDLLDALPKAGPHGICLMPTAAV